MRSSNGVKPHSLRKQDSLEDRVLGSEIHQGNGKWQGFSWPCPNICRIIGVEIQESPPPPGCLLGFCCFVLFVGVFFRFFCLFGWFALVFSSLFPLRAVTSGRNAPMALCSSVPFWSCFSPTPQQDSAALVPPPSLSMWTGQKSPEPSANTSSSNSWALSSPPPPRFYLQPLHHMWILLSPCRNCWCRTLTIICCLQECNKPFNCSSLSSLSFCGLQRGEKAAWGEMS